MGASVSHAAEMDGPTHVPMPEDEPEATSKTTQLPQPVKYEDLQREVLMSLKPDLFEGVRFDFAKPLNAKFSLSHSVYMGSIEVPTQSTQVVKMPMATYEFGANWLDTRTMLIGRILTDGRMTGRIKHDLTEDLSVKFQTQLTNEAGYSQGMLDLDYKGSDWNAQLKVGNSQFYGINYLQSVTDNLALGGEAFWLGSQRKSGVGFAARHQSDQCIATCQVATTGLLSLTYLHKLSDKAALVSEMMWNWNARDASASFGYDYILRQCRLRGRVDSNGAVAAYLEERLNVGVNFILSAEVDHSKKDYKFGFGMTVGE